MRGCLDLGVEVITGGGSGDGGGSDSGGDGGGGGSGGADEPPGSDPAADAFQRVQVGSCLRRLPRPSDAGTRYCREGSSGRRTYWSLVVANRTILVCFTYPNS